jgi:Ca2+:H+ antiporter
MTNNSFPFRSAFITTFAWLAFLIAHIVHAPIFIIVTIAALIVAVLNAVYHAEVIAERVGQPFGALLLALAVTVIEVSIILSLMLIGSNDVAVLARDTVFAAVMIILTGMTGITLLIGGIKFNEPKFNAQGIVSVLTVLVTISVLTLILPNYTKATPGPYYSQTQLVFISVITLLLYGSFLFVQNFKHRSHFVTESEQVEVHVKPSTRTTIYSAIFLPLNLIAVVLLAEHMAPNLEHFTDSIGAPPSLSGIIIACVILLPEGITAIKAANQNQMQRSLNLSLGSALASISLTIPVVAVFSVVSGLPLAMGIDAESALLFLLSLFIIILSLSLGKTTVLQGVILLLLFAVYLFITLFP